MAANYGALVTYCQSILDTFDPSSQSVEDHSEQYVDVLPLDEDEKSFVQEVFSGCVRYSKVLDVLVKGFYNRDGKNILRSEENLYRVFAYLVLFRLDELEMSHFRQFVRTQKVRKMYQFLQFFIDDKNLRTWIKDEWTKMYELHFVQTTLLSPLLRWQPELQELVEQLKDRMENKNKLKKPETSTTEFQPFNLTQPRPRSVPLPQAIPRLKPHRPVPKTTYVTPKESDVMAQIREENRRKAEERLMEASKLQIACANTDKSEKTKQRMKEIMLEQERQLDFERHSANPVPRAILNDNIPVKLNAATILREGKLYQKREEDELKKLEKLEAGERDASDFLEWQSRMKKMDLDQQLAEIERRRLEGKLSHEDAILARQNMIKENRLRVAEMKEEAERLMQEYMEKKLQEDQEMRKVVEDVLDSHENAKLAKKKLQEYKAKIVQEVSEESRELMRQALEQAAEDMRQKMELIREIRAMEATPVIRHKLVDLTITAGHGLLSEMSIAELRERAAWLKVAETAENEEKRDDILAAKQAKDQMLIDTLEQISRHRTESSKAAAIRLEEKKKTHAVKPEVKDPKLIELQRRLEAKKAERLQLHKESKISPNQKSQRRLRELNASKKLLEEGRWQELEGRRQRTAQLAAQGHIPASPAASRIATKTQIMTSGLN